MRGRAALACAATLLACACIGHDDAEPAGPAPASVDADDPAYDVALSAPVEDRVYPEVGEPGVDALHYHLDLAWDPDHSRLTGVETLVFRAAETDGEFQLDLAPQLDVSEVLVDGDPVDHEQRAKDLVLEAEVVEDERYVVVVRYSGAPQPVPAPATRPDLPTLGWTVTGDGSTWTMQEPYGAYTWYAVNDQPSDKALYDFTLRVPSPMVGVANGRLGSRTTDDGQVVTEWSMAEPAASYLVTVAFGEFEHTEATARSGVPVSVWAPAERAHLLPRLLRRAVAALDWSERRLGRYPYESLGFLFLDATSGIETQTMVTLGMSKYAMSTPVLVHETVHQWWGNLVTPRDWRDLWMSEGMALYHQALWESAHGGPSFDAILDEWQHGAQELRDRAGPPAAYDPQAFADRNVYILPALMWHEIRERIGDKRFFRLVARWPRADEDGSADYDEITTWWERETGEELTELFEQHLLGERQPPAA